MIPRSFLKDVFQTFLKKSKTDGKTEFGKVCLLRNSKFSAFSNFVYFCRYFTFLQVVATFRRCYFALPQIRFLSLYFVTSSLPGRRKKVPENKQQNQSRISPIYAVQEDLFEFDEKNHGFAQKNFEITENVSRRYVKPDESSNKIVN